MKKELTLLGSTGSVGTQALAVAKHLGCVVSGLASKSNTALLERQAREFRPRRVAIADPGLYRALKTALADTDISVLAGEDAVACLARQSCDVVLNAIVGVAGLRASLAALKAGRTLALANKESLVAAGGLVMAAADSSGAKILPVDSEHSAIFQCLNGENRDRINKILLTASGGPFFGRTAKELQGVTVQQALRHPNWSMGKKITVDSATLMNKGLELIEAMHLFSVLPGQIEILVHPQSILHSAVEFSDGAVMAQLGAPDMRLPIQYALTWPERQKGIAALLSLSDAGSLTFAPPDERTFACLAAAKQAARQGGLAPCVLNGANEAAVELFLRGEVGFLQIGELVWGALSHLCYPMDYSIDDVFEADAAARAWVFERHKVGQKGVL